MLVEYILEQLALLKLLQFWHIDVSEGYIVNIRAEVSDEIPNGLGKRRDIGTTGFLELKIGMIINRSRRIFIEETVYRLDSLL